MKIVSSPKEDISTVDVPVVLFCDAVIKEKIVLLPQLEDVKNAMCVRCSAVT